jgi:hypothetical protein
LALKKSGIPGGSWKIIPTKKIWTVSELLRTTITVQIFAVLLATIAFVYRGIANKKNFSLDLELRRFFSVK